MSLIDLQNSGHQGYKKSIKMLSIDQAISLGILLRDTAIVSLEELRYYLPPSLFHGKEVNCSVVIQLLICSPLLLVKKQNNNFLVNMHQMEFECKGLERLFSYDTKTGTVASEPMFTKEEKGKKRSRGRKSVVDKFPDIPRIATEYVKANGFKAQERRRETTFRSCGVTIKELRDYLLETISGLDEHGLGITTVRYLFQPVKKGTFAAENYKGLIDGKVAGKDNTDRKTHINGHYLNSRIKLRKEFAAYLNEECVTVSCDTMNKLMVGTLAASRYHQIRKIFLKDDKPQYPDHDFPLVKVIPDGIMILQSKDSSNSALSPDVIIVDDNDTVRSKRLSIIQQNEINESQQKHQQILDENLLRAGFQIVTTNADGNCLFESLSKEPENRTGTTITATEIRSQVCDHLEENRNDFLHLYPTESYDKEKEFVREINVLCNSGMWNNQLSDIILPVIGTLDNCIVVVYTSFDRCPIITFASSKADKYEKIELPVLFLRYNACRGHEHYSPLEPIHEQSH